MSVLQDIQTLRQKILRKTESGKYEYKLVNSFEGTTAEAQSEQIISRFLRRFQPVKEERHRRTNIALGFDFHTDSLMDYPSIIQHKIGGEWTKYNMLIAAHVPTCPYSCWHCYNDKKLHSPQNADWISAQQLIDEFVKQREHDSRRQAEFPSNVLRITGGEPFLVPELILECLRELKARGLHEQVFIWTETDLYPFIPEGGQSFVGGLTIRDGNEERKVLEELARQEHKNLAVHPCLHGLDINNIRQITGRDDISLEQLLLALEGLLKSGIDIYPTFGSNISPPEDIPNIFRLLYEMDRNLPLRLALVEYDTDYKEIQRRLVEDLPTRPCRLYSKYTNLRIWNDLLMRHYNIGYGVVPRHIVQLGEGATKVVPARNGFLTKESDQPGNELLYIFKSSYREDYHRELLDMLALPSGHIYQLEYDKQWVQDDLWHHVRIRPEDYCGKQGLLLYVDLDSTDKRVIPLRRLEIKQVEVQGEILLILFELKSFVHAPSAKPDYIKDLRKKLETVFGEYTLPDTPLNKLVLLAEEIQELRGLKEGSDLPAWREVLDVLHKNRCTKFENSLFYRVEIKDATRVEVDSPRPGTAYEVSGRKFSILVEYYLPNYDILPKDVEARTIVYESSSDIVEAIVPQQFVLSKYGSQALIFTTKVVPEMRTCSIHFQGLSDPFKAPMLNLPIHVKGSGHKIAAGRAIGNTSFALGGGLIDAVIPLLTGNMISSALAIGLFVFAAMVILGGTYLAGRLAER